jgi:hypothetical protein
VLARRWSASSSAAARSSTSTTASRASTSGPRASQDLVPRARVAVAHGQMSEAALEQRDARLRRGPLRRAVRDGDHRERPRHPARQHDPHRSRRHVRPLAALPAARPRRPLPRARLLLPGRRRPRTRCRTSRARASRPSSGTPSSARASTIASLDLELSGGGDLLGADQSGTVASVGFELFCELLDRAVHELRGEPVVRDIDPELSIRRGGAVAGAIRRRRRRPPVAVQAPRERRGRWRGRRHRRRDGGPLRPAARRPRSASSA